MTSICENPYCNKEVHAKGFCSSHYSALVQGYDPMRPPKKIIPDYEENGVTYRYCSQCKTNQPVDNFYTNSKGGRIRICMTCHKLNNKIRRDKNPDKSRDKRYKYLYGISLEDYDKRVQDQNGVCAICLESPDGKGKASRLVVDHCHKSGKIRGLLCGKCNVLLGNADERLHVFKAAVNYLENHMELEGS